MHSVPEQTSMMIEYACTSWGIISERKPDGTLLTYQLLEILEFHSNGDSKKSKLFVCLFKGRVVVLRVASGFETELAVFPL